jgi:hypothetical protein
MKTASIKELKTTLEAATHEELFDYCLQLIKYKKENKELLTYLLYEKNDATHYINGVKDELDTHFKNVRLLQLYYVKKTIGKIIRIANRYIKYSKDAIIEIEITLHVAERIQSLHLPLERNKALQNMYLSLLKKINQTLQNLHEDEQYDYMKRIKRL